MGKFYNISTDPTLGGNSASDNTVSSQKAVKDYVDSHSSGSPSWGSIQGTLSNQTDLQLALDGKQATLVSGTNIKTINGNSVLGSGDLTVSGGASRNIGEIIQSTIPLTDAGLHLLDGSLISGSGIYSGFVTYIARLVSDYPSLFDTEANWQSAVTTYGVCGKFVYDSVNNTVRLPKFGNEIYTSDLANTAPIKGDGKALGLTNGTENFGLRSGQSGLAIATAGYGSTLPNSPSGALTSKGSIGLTLDATNSGVIADLSLITTPLEGYWYIVVANYIDVEQITIDLNSKADVDLSNMNPTQTVKNTIVGWGMPDFSAGVAFTGTITLPCDALVYSFASGGGVWVGAGFKINGVQISNSSAYGSTSCCYAAKGSTVQAGGDGSACKYYPLKGVN